jgi:hypothetical protein
MGAEKEIGDYVGYQIQTNEGEGIQLVGPISKPEAVRLENEIKNSYETTAIRVSAQNQGDAILKITEAFNRREKLKEKGILT